MTETFEIIKVNPVINIAVDNVTYGNNVVIIVTVPGASGNVTIKINDTDKGEFTLVNGKVVFDAGILSLEIYSLNRGHVEIKKNYLNILLTYNFREIFKQNYL